MKYMKYLMLLGMFSFFSVTGFARARNEGSFTLQEPASIGSTQLQPGTYKAEWNGTGSTVEVNIVQHKNTVATTSAQLKTNDGAVSQDAVVVKPANDSSKKQIAEIDFGSHKEALVITPNQVTR